MQIMRHKTLTETNEDLISVVQRNQDDIEQMHAQLAALVKEKNDLILVYNSKLVSQQKYLDSLKQNWYIFMEILTFYQCLPGTKD